MTVALNLTQNPPVTLMQTSFPGSTLDGWAYSPQGLASNWSVSNGVVSYNGGGASQIYAGNNTWSNYAVQASFRLSTLTDYPGGIRGYVNPSTGASYAAWLYPAEGVVKLWRTTTWNINTSPGRAPPRPYTASPTASRTAVGPRAHPAAANGRGVKAGATPGCSEEAAPAESVPVRPPIELRMISVRRWNAGA